MKIGSGFFEQLPDLQSVIWWVQSVNTGLLLDPLMDLRQEKEILRALWIMDVAFWRQYHYTEHNMDSSGHGCWLVKLVLFYNQVQKCCSHFQQHWFWGYFSHDFFPIWILKSLWLIVISPKLSQLATRWITKLALENLRQKDKSYKALIRKITTIPRSIANDNRIKKWQRTFTFIKYAYKCLGSWVCRQRNWTLSFTVLHRSAIYFLWFSDWWRFLCIIMGLFSKYFCHWRFISYCSKYLMHPEKYSCKK